MQAIKLKRNNENISDTDLDLIDQHQYQNTGLFHQTFIHQELLNSEYNKQLSEQYTLLDVSMIEECKKEVKNKIKQVEAFVKDNIQTIKNIDDELPNLIKEKDRLQLIIDIQKDKQNKKDEQNELLNFNSNSLNKPNKKSSKNRLKSQMTKLNKSINKLENKKTKSQEFIDKMERTNNTGIIFGTKSLLQKITHLANKINTELAKTGTDRDEELIKGYQERYSELKQEYSNNRLLAVYIEGETIQYGNRKFSFDFTNNRIIFKPNRDCHIPIEFYASNNQKKILNQLQILSDNKQIPLTVRLSKDYICITFDELKLTNYQFKEKDYKKELSNFKRQNETSLDNLDLLSDDQQIKLIQDKKNIYIRYAKDQKNRMLVGKLDYRYMSVDLNPFEIGIVIADKITTIDKETGEEIVKFKIIKKYFVDLSRLNAKIIKSELVLGDDEMTRLDKLKKQWDWGEDKYKVEVAKLLDDKYKRLKLKQNNKREHEIKESWCSVFKVAKHYKIGHLIIEELDLKEKTVNQNSTVLNRNVKNYWHRTLTTELINKNCNLLGIEKIEVNPVYSSVIGNILHDDYDCIASAKELMRRGVDKYKLGNKLYPLIDEVCLDKLSGLVKKNQSYVLDADKSSISGSGSNKSINKLLNREFKDWKELYSLLLDSGLSYRNKSKRRGLTNLGQNGLSGGLLNLKSHKSKVKVYNYS